MAAHRPTRLRSARRRTRIFAVQLAVHDVWRGHRYWHAHLLHGGTDISPATRRPYKVSAHRGRGQRQKRLQVGPSAYGLTPWAHGVIGIALEIAHDTQNMLTIRFRSTWCWLIDFRMARTSRRYCRHFGDSDWAGRHNRLRGFAVFCRPVQYQRLFVSDERQWPTDAERPDRRLGFDRQRVVFVGPVEVQSIRWLSNINMGLSIFLVSFFILFGSTAFALMTFGYAIPVTCSRCQQCR